MTHGSAIALACCTKVVRYLYDESAYFNTVLHVDFVPCVLKLLIGTHTSVL